MTKETITGSVNVWHTTSRWMPLSEIKKLPSRSAISELNYSNADMSDVKDWVKVGKATVTVTFDNDETVTTEQLASLNRQLTLQRAENHMREKQITDQISNLLALTLSPTTKEI